MKIVVYGPQRRVGALDGSSVVDLNGAYAKYAGESLDEPRPQAAADAVVPANLQDLIEAGARGVEGAQKALDHLSRASNKLGAGGETIVHDAAAVKLHAPLPSRAARIMMAAANYADHLHGIMVNRQGHANLTVQGAYESARKRGITGFWKLARHVGASGDEVIYPARTQHFDYEAEVAVILGKRGKDIPAGELGEYVWGITMQNDWSLRDPQENGGGALSLSLAKNFDGSSTLGPCIVVGENLDPQNIDFETRVNGQLRQRGNSKDMIFSFDEYLQWLSRDMTLEPGDIISAGTCAGTAMDSGNDANYLKPGDVVDINSPQIGAQTNRVVAKS